jgi:hypothetical protein
MSAEIHYEPVKTTKRLKCDTPLTIIEKLQEAFGASFPMTLDKDDLSILRGMAIASGDVFYEAVMDAISKHGEIRLSVKY